MVFLHISESLGLAGALAGTLCLLLCARLRPVSDHFAIGMTGVTLLSFGTALLAVAMSFPR